MHLARSGASATPVARRAVAVAARRAAPGDPSGGGVGVARLSALARSVPPGRLPAARAARADASRPLTSGAWPPAEGLAAEVWRADGRSPPGPAAAGGAVSRAAPTPLPAAAPWSASDRRSGQSPWLRSDLRVVLVHPQIPQNAGSVARTCAAAGVPLHLVSPLGFRIDSAKLKRAGLDYWDHVCCEVHEDVTAFLDYARREEATGSSGAFSSGLPRMVAFSKYGDRHFAEEGLYRRGGGEVAPERGEGKGASPRGEREEGTGGGVAGPWGARQEGGRDDGHHPTSSSGEVNALPPTPATWLLFGAETTGLPAEAIEAVRASPGGAVVKLPIRERHVRSLNLAACVAVGVFEALRQLDGATL